MQANRLSTWIMRRSVTALAVRTLGTIFGGQFSSISAPFRLDRRPLSSYVSEATGDEGRLSSGNGDRLILRGMRFHGHHGVYEEERKLGQKFEVDVDAWLDLRKAGETDQLEHSVSYADIYGQVQGIVEGPPRLLLESVATNIAASILQRHPRISDVRVRVGKPHVAVQGVVEVLGVEIFRSSCQFSKHLKSDDDIDRTS